MHPLAEIKSARAFLVGDLSSLNVPVDIARYTKLLNALYL